MIQWGSKLNRAEVSALTNDSLSKHQPLQLAYAARFLKPCICRMKASDSSLCAEVQRPGEQRPKAAKLEMFDDV